MDPASTSFPSSLIFSSPVVDESPVISPTPTPISLTSFGTPDGTQSAITTSTNLLLPTGVAQFDPSGSGTGTLIEITNILIGVGMPGLILLRLLAFLSSLTGTGSLVMMLLIIACVLRYYIRDKMVREWQYYRDLEEIEHKREIARKEGRKQKTKNKETEAEQNEELKRRRAEWKENQRKEREARGSQ